MKLTEYVGNPLVAVTKTDDLRDVGFELFQNGCDLSQCAFSYGNLSAIDFSQMLFPLNNVASWRFVMTNAPETIPSSYITFAQTKYNSSYGYTVNSFVAVELISVLGCVAVLAWFAVRPTCILSGSFADFLFAIFEPFFLHAHSSSFYPLCLNSLCAFFQLFS